MFYKEFWKYLCFQTYILINVQGMVVSTVEYFIFREATVSV